MHKRLIILSIILTLLLAPIKPLAESPEYDLDYFLQVKELIEYNYLNKPSEKELIEGAIKGLFYSLDETAAIIPKKNFRS